MLGNRKWIFLTLIMVTIVGCSRPDQKTAFRGPDAWRPTPQPAPENVLEDKAPTILPGTYVAAARMFESRGMIGKAITQYRKAIAVNQAYAPAYHRLGLLLSMTGKREEAIQMLRRAASLDPDSAVIRNNLGFELVLAERWHQAEPELTAAIRLNPSFPRANVNLGIVQSKLGRFDEALASFRRVLPEADAQYNIGLMYRGQGRYQEAANAFRVVLDLDPHFVAASTQLSQLAMRHNVRPDETAAVIDWDREPVFAQRPERSRLGIERSDADVAMRYDDDSSWDGPFEEDRRRVARSVDNRGSQARTVSTRQQGEHPDDRWDELDSIIEIAENEIRCLQEREEGPQSSARQGQDTHLAKVRESSSIEEPIEREHRISINKRQITGTDIDNQRTEREEQVGLTKDEVLAMIGKSNRATEPSIARRGIIDEGGIIECFADIEGPVSPADPIIPDSIFTPYDLVYGETLLVGADNPLDAHELIQILEEELQVVRNEINCLEDPFDSRIETFAGPIRAIASPHGELAGPPQDLARPRSAIEIIRRGPAPPRASLSSHKKDKASQEKRIERRNDERIEPIPPVPASPRRPIDPDRGASTWHPETPANISDQVDALLAAVMGEITGWDANGAGVAFPQSSVDGEPIQWLFSMFEADDECQYGVVVGENLTTRADPTVRVSGLHGRGLQPMP